jgi:hypothetical protein
MKKGRLNKVEQNYITTNLDKLSIEELSADLERSISAISKYIESLKAVIEPDQQVPRPRTNAEVASAMKTMQHLTVNKKSGVTVMTKAASEVMDDIRLEGSTRSKSVEKYITKVFKDESTS